MVSLLPFRIFGRQPAELSSQLTPATLSSASEQPAFLTGAPVEALADAFDQVEESTVMRTLGWISAGLGALALGLFVGRELRQRYKFNRRTPYDFYAHSGDEITDVEFGVGV